MKRLLFNLLLILVFLIGNINGLFYALVERHDMLSNQAVYKYRIINSLGYFISLVVSMWLLKSSTRRQKDFVLIGGMYGVASLVYDIIFVQIVGGLLLLSVLFRIYFKLFPEDKLWQKTA